MKVSIITVSLNSVNTIERTMQSVIGQTYSDVEYIVIDGGSTDGTKDMIEQYKDHIACWISEKDNGIYDAMNKGLDLASGEIIGILNSDDWYEKDAVAKVVGEFEKSDADMVYGRVAFVYSNGVQYVNKNAGLSTVRYQMAPPHPATFVRRSIYERVGKFDTRYRIAADYDMLLRIYTRHGRIREIPEVLTYFRRGGASNRYLTVCAEETRMISYQYTSYFPGEDYREKIENTYQNLCERASLLDKLEQIRTLENDELERRKRMILKRSHIYMFGTGRRMLDSLVFLNELNIQVHCFWDNDPARKGMTLYEIPIEAPFGKKTEHPFIIISSLKYRREIEAQLTTLGYEEEEDFLAFDALIDKLLQEV